MAKAPVINKQRQAAILMACGAGVAFSLSPVARHLGGFVGLSADTWQWSLLAIGFALLCTSLVLLVRSGKFRRRF